MGSLGLHTACIFLATNRVHNIYNSITSIRPRINLFSRKEDVDQHQFIECAIHIFHVIAFMLASISSRTNGFYFACNYHANNLPD